MAKNKYFSLVEAIKFASETVFQNFGFLFKLLITVAAICISAFLGITLIAAVFFRNTTNHPLLIPVGIILLLLFTLFKSFLGLGYYKIMLNFYENKENTLATLFSQKTIFLKYFSANIIYFVMVALGTLLFIVPGIILAIMFGFYPYIMIEEKTGIIDSFKRSASITSGYKWPLFGLQLILILANTVSARIFTPALLFTLPFISLTWVFAYRKLKQQEKEDYKEDIYIGRT